MPDPPPVMRATVSFVRKIHARSRVPRKYDMPHTLALHAEEVLKLETVIVDLGRHFGMY